MPQIILELTPKMMADLTIKGNITNETPQQLVEGRVFEYCAAVSRDVGTDKRQKLREKIESLTDDQLDSADSKLKTV